MSADTPDKRLDAVAFIERLIGAWDCCGTCAGGVLAERDRAVVAAERERADAAEAKIAAVEALADDIERQSGICNVGNTQTISARLRAALGGEATP